MFTWTNLLVVVAELDGGENEALDLVPLVTNVVLEVRGIANPLNNMLSRLISWFNQYICDI